MSASSLDRGAHASRVLAIASRDRELFLYAQVDHEMRVLGKDCFGATPKPSRETRALPEES